MTEISQFGSFNQPYVVQKAPFMEPQVPTPKSYLLNQPIKDEVLWKCSSSCSRAKKWRSFKMGARTGGFRRTGAYFLNMDILKVKVQKLPLKL